MVSGKMEVNEIKIVNRIRRLAKARSVMLENTDGKFYHWEVPAKLRTREASIKARIAELNRILETYF